METNNFNLILFTGTEKALTLVPDGFYSSPNAEMFFRDENRSLYKKECRGTTVFFCTPAGEAFKPVGNLDVRSLWQDFGDVPMNPETECLDEPWLHFEAGTFREEIWKWFEREFSISVEKLMNSTDGYKYFMNHRPLSIGTVPNGFIEFDENDSGGRYGAVYYSRPLDDQEVKDYELLPAHI